MTVTVRETASEVQRDRDRIADQLGDRVVRKLFTVVLGLHGVAGAVNDDREHAALVRLIGELDGAITQIRSIAFDLGDPSVPPRLKRGTPAA